MAIGQETATTSTILIYYVVASVVAYFRRPPTTAEAAAKSASLRPRLWKTLLGVTIFTILISIVESCWQSAAINGLRKEVNDTLFADLFFVVTWVILLLGLIHSKCEVRYPHFGAWVLSLIRGGVIIPNRYWQPWISKEAQIVMLVLVTLETAATLLTILVGLLQKHLRSPSVRDDSPESQPLLREQNESADATKTDDKKDREEREDSEDEKARKEIRDRPIRKYLTSFKIFLPYMIPNSTRQRFYFGGMCICSVAERIVNIATPLILGAVINGLGHWRMPWKEIFIYILLTLLESSVGVSLLETILNLRLSQEQGLAMNRAAYDHVMNLSASFQDSKSSASVWQSLYQARSVVSLFHDVAFDVAPSIFDLVAGFIVLSTIFGGYMALLLITSIVSFLWLTVNALPPKAELQRKHREAYIAEFYQLVESSSNWHTCTQFGQIPREKQQFRIKGQATQDAFFQSAYYGYSTRSVRVFIHMMAFFGAASLAALEISNVEQNIGAFVVLTSYWAQLSQPLYAIVEEINRTLEKLVDAERLLVLLEREPAVKDAPDAKEYKYLGGAVEFEDVHFSYDGKRNASEGTSFRTAAGTQTAIVGETGGGKSTLMKLLFRFYDPEKGRVLIDGQDIKDLQMDSFRKHIGVVPQDPALFNTTILDNVRYPDFTLGEKEVQAACKAAALHDRIMTFPKGYQEKAGERGCRLSGGELQRLAIARVILKKPDILLLDEATSSVDSLTEQHIQKSLDEMCKGKTTFVIAHRLSTILKSDQTLVIDGGKIVESGTHAELLEKKGAYHKLWTTQLKLQRDAEKADKTSADKEGLTLVNDLRESEEESTELIRVTSEADKDEKSAKPAKEEVAEVNGREQLEGKPATKEARGRQTVKDVINSFNRRLSSSRSPKPGKNGKDSGSQAASPIRSRLKANAPEFVPRSIGKGQSDGSVEVGENVAMRNKKEKESGAGKDGRRRATSEPAVRDGGESEGDVTPEDESGTARYSRIPKKRR